MRSGRILLLPVALSAICAGGCVTKRPPTFHISDAAVARPVLRAANDAGPDVPPDIRVEPVAPPIHLAAPRSGPARPRVTSQPAPESVTNGKSPDPLIVPELSSEELASAKAETARSLEVAEKTLGQMQGRALNATQADLASKVRAFMESAREAVKIGDWSRARNLSRKAELLSAELSDRR